MGTETFIWTILPDGVEGSKLRFSLFLSPRLSPSGKLGEFPVGQGTAWPERVKGLQVVVQFDGGPLLQADVQTAELRADVWGAVFPEDTPVKGYDLPPHAGRKLRSFPVRPLHQFIGGLYSAVASDPVSADGDFPSLDAGTPVGDFVGTVGRIPELVRRYKQEEGAILKNLRSVEEQSFYLASRFYDRGTQEPPVWAGETKPELPELLTIPDFDFHQAVAALGDHPKLLRHLGLVIDCVVDAGQVRLPIPLSGKVKVAALKWKDEPGAGHVDETPWTAYERGEGVFRARAKSPSDLAAGFLRLGNKDAYEVMQVDLDGAALNTLQFASNHLRYKQETAKTIPPQMQEQVQSQSKLNSALRSPALSPKKASLPALRTGGFTVARVDRATRTKDAFARQTAHQALMSDSVVMADDVLRGFRIDVLDEKTNNWFGLCRRRARYILPGVDPIEVADEGYVKGSAATSTTTGGPTSDLYLHEAIFGWDGWSLVATRPGHSIAWVDDEATRMTRKQPQAIKTIRNEPKGAFKLEPVIKAEPGSLPRLRFGRNYRFRARTTDLAGNGLPFKVEATPTEALSAKKPYLRFEPVPSPTLVHRTTITEGEQLENMVIRTRVSTTASEAELPSSLFSGQNDRHVLPPKTTQFNAETHGMLDGIADPKISYRISAKEKGTIQDQQILDETTGAMVPVAGVVLKDALETPADKWGVWPAPGEPLARGQYVLHTLDSVALPYLPDPLCEGMAIQDFPGQTYLPVPFVGGWPTPKTFRIMLLSGGSETMGVDGDGNVVVKLPPASIVKLRFSSFLAKRALDEMAIWQNMTAAARGSDEIKKSVLLGKHWMLTPSRELQLVHAVERPIEAPQTQAGAHQGGSQKVVGQTFTYVDFAIKTHSHSTGDLAIDGKWFDIEDRVTQLGPPVPEERVGHVLDVKVDYEEPTVLVPKPIDKGNFPKHEFGDTKHRRVNYFATGTTRFREYFPPAVFNNKALITLVGPSLNEVNILSSARPDPARVLYIVPTFKWQDSNDGKSHTRLGRGLRVYLDRPWYSSGIEERLAVLVAPTPGIKGVDADTWKYVSEWGADPVFDSEGPKVELAPQHLVNKVHTQVGLQLAEQADLPVTACAFDVQFNTERQLWYCDIEIDPGATYFPYVRLALARFQQWSIPGVELSRVVRTEFAQLVADRGATVSQSPDGFIDVSVAGPSASTEMGLKLPNPPLRITAQTASVSPLAVQAATVTDVVAPTPTDSPALPPPLFPIFIRNADAGDGHLVKIHLERRQPQMPGDLGWETVGFEVMLDSYTWFLSKDTFWRGRIRAPQPIANTQPFDYRLVIREFELFETDREVATDDDQIHNPRRYPVGERLVYVDTFPLGRV